MLSELNQLLACRREREDRAAGALRRARDHHAVLEAALVEVETRLGAHYQERQSRHEQLYKQSLRSRLTVYQIDELNIELDLMAEETDALVDERRRAEAKVEEAANAVEKATAVYRKYRKAGDRWKHLVDDVAGRERLEREQAEELAIEDDIGDRQASIANGGW